MIIGRDHLSLCGAANGRASVWRIIDPPHFDVAHIDAILDDQLAKVAD